jgi:hypothetical protein
VTELQPYGTGGAVESAIRDAARAAATPDRDTSRLIREAYFDRFLCRVFAYGSDAFVLKGGTGMLARIPTARSTMDIDLAASERSIEAATAALIAAAAIDLGDHFRFVHRDTAPVLEGDGQPYTDGVRVRFDTYVGVGRKGGVSIDLVLGHTPTTAPVRMAPANRLPVARLLVNDYRLYPVVDQIADKVCASETTYGTAGNPSTRVKDLVDLVLLARTETIDGTALTAAIAAERRRRQLPDRTTFTPPAAFGRQWQTEAAKGNLPPELDLAAAVILVSHFLEPAFTEAVTGQTWHPEHQRWRALKSQA